MGCPHCGYDVRDLPSATCPECGSPFDPESALKPHDPPIDRSVVWFSAVGVGWPLVIQLWTILMLVVARLQLGHWPHRWGADDPKNIPIVNLMLLPLLVALLAAIPFMIAGMVGLAYGLAYRRRLTGWLLAAVVASWAAAWLIGDRAEAWLWILD